MLSLFLILRTKHRTKIQSGLRDETDTLIISTAECQRLFSKINDDFTPTINSLVLRTVSHLRFVKGTMVPVNLLAQKV